MKTLSTSSSELEMLKQRTRQLISDYREKNMTLNRQYLLEELPLVMTAFEQGLLFEDVLPTNSDVPLFLVYPKPIESIFSMTKSLLKESVGDTPFATHFIEVHIDAWEEDDVEHCRAHIPDQEQLRKLLTTKNKYCVFLTSLGKYYHENAHLQATLNLFSSLIQSHQRLVGESTDEEISRHQDDQWHMRVVLGDTLQAYNTSIGELSEAQKLEYESKPSSLDKEAYLKTLLPSMRTKWREKGDQWLLDAIPKYQRLAAHNVHLKPREKRSDEEERTWLASDDVKQHRWSELLVTANRTYRFKELRWQLYSAYWGQREQFVCALDDAGIDKVIDAACARSLKIEKQRKSPCTQAQLLHACITQVTSNAGDPGNRLLRNEINLFYYFEKMTLDYLRRGHAAVPQYLPAPTKRKPSEIDAQSPTTDLSAQATRRNCGLVRRYIKKQLLPGDGIEEQLLMADMHLAKHINLPSFPAMAYVGRQRLDVSLAENLALQHGGKTAIHFLFGASGLGKKKAIWNCTNTQAEKYQFIAWFSGVKWHKVKSISGSIVRGLGVVQEMHGLPKAHSEEQYYEKLIELIETADKRCCLVFYNVQNIKTLTRYLPKRNCDVFITQNRSIANKAQVNVADYHTVNYEVRRLDQAAANSLAYQLVGDRLTENEIDSLCAAYQFHSGLIEAASIYLAKRANLSPQRHATVTTLPAARNWFSTQLSRLTNDSRNECAPSVLQNSTRSFQLLYDHILAEDFKQRGLRKKVVYILSVASLLDGDNLPMAFLRTCFAQEFEQEMENTPRIFDSAISKLCDCKLLLSNAGGANALTECFANVVREKMKSNDTFASILGSITRALLNYILDSNPLLDDETYRDAFYPHLRALLDRFDEDDNSIVLGDLYYILAVYESQSDPRLSYVHVEKAEKCYLKHVQQVKLPKFQLLMQLILLRKSRYLSFVRYNQQADALMLKLKISRNHFNSELAQNEQSIDRRCESVIAERMSSKRINNSTKRDFVQHCFTRPADACLNANGFNTIEKHLFAGVDVAAELQFSMLIMHGKFEVYYKNIGAAQSCYEKALDLIDTLSPSHLLQQTALALLNVNILFFSGRPCSARKSVDQTLLPFAHRYSGVFPLFARDCYDIASAVYNALHDFSSAVAHSQSTLDILIKISGNRPYLYRTFEQRHRAVSAKLRGNFAAAASSESDHNKNSAFLMYEQRRHADTSLRSLSWQEISDVIDASPEGYLLPNYTTGKLTLSYACLTAIQHDYWLILNELLMTTRRGTENIQLSMNEQNDTLLHVAAKYRAKLCINLLLEFRVNTIAVNNLGQVPFDSLPADAFELMIVFLEHWFSLATEYATIPEKFDDGVALITQAYNKGNELFEGTNLMQKVTDLYLDYMLRKACPSENIQQTTVSDAYASAGLYRTRSQQPQNTLDGSIDRTSGHDMSSQPW